MHLKGEEAIMGKIITSLRMASGIFAMGAGFYHGFCNSQGMPTDKNVNSLEGLVLYAPSFIMAGLTSAERNSILSNPSPREDDIVSEHVSLAIGGGGIGVFISATGYFLGYAFGGSCKS
jgi:hypothetical protein